jgi:hypothetical protein
MAMVVIDGDRSDCGTPRRDVFRAHPHGVGEGIYSVSLWFPYPRRIARDGRAHGSHLPRSHRAVSAPNHSRGHSPTIHQSINRMSVTAMGLPRSDSAMTLRGQKSKPAPSCVYDHKDVACVMLDVDDQHDARASWPAPGASSARAPRDAPSSATVGATHVRARWYTLVKIHDDGSSRAVSDAELAMLEARILQSGAGATLASVLRRAETNGGERDEEGDEETMSLSMDDSADGILGRDGDAMATTATTKLMSSSANAAPAGLGQPQHKPGGPCDHCGALDSPQWRRGPSSKPMLCNACGTRFRRTGNLGSSPLSRSATPAATPTKRKAVAAATPATPSGRKKRHAVLTC